MKGREATTDEPLPAALSSPAQLDPGQPLLPAPGHSAQVPTS